MALAQRELRSFWGSLNTGGDAARVRDATLRYFPKLLTQYGDAAALLGADWYDLNRNVAPSAARFRAVIAATAPAEQAEASARWAIGPLFQAASDPVQALANLNGVTQRLVLQPGRDTIWNSATRDPVRTGIARVPSGPSTCSFCIMLASRGAVYKTDAAAGHENSFHNDCDCVPTIIRSRDDYPEDHDLDEYRRLYAEGSGVVA